MSRMNRFLEDPFDDFFSDMPALGAPARQEQQEEQWENESAVPGTDANYVKVLLEAEAQHWEKDLFLGHYSLSGVFFAISDSPETLASYFLSCTEGNYYRG